MTAASSLKPILGHITAFTINTPDLESSFQFYQKLGFKEVMRSDFPFPFIQVTDDAILIMLRKANEPYIALTYYCKDNTIVAELEQKGIQLLSKPKPGEFVQRYLFQSPDKTNISLVVMPDGFTPPTGKTMLMMEQSDYFKPETYTNKVAGMFGEFAQAVTDLEQSIGFWQKIGFTTLSKFSSPHPWAIMSDGLATIGLHQATHFNSPTITFFAADMKSKIDALGKSGLEWKELSPGNIVLTTPEHQKIFLFKMGM